MKKLVVAFRNFAKAPNTTSQKASRNHVEGWNFNSGNYLFTTDTK